MPDLSLLQQIANSAGESRRDSSQPSLDAGYKTENTSTLEGVFGRVAGKTLENSVFLNDEQRNLLEQNNLYPVLNQKNSDINELIEDNKKKQTAIGKIGRSLAQIVEDEIILGSVKGFSDIADAAYNLLFTDFEENDYTNPLSAKLENLIDRNKERLAIQRENPYKHFDWGDLGWWTDNMVNIGSTVALMIPSKILTNGLGRLAKLSKVDKLATGSLNAVNKISKDVFNGKNVFKRPNLLGQNINNAVENITAGALSRIAENYQEARDVYKTSYDSTIETLNNLTPEQKADFFRIHPEYNEGMSNEEIAKNIVGKAAKQVFDHDMWLLGIDALQFRAIQSGRTAMKASNVAVRKAERLAEESLADAKVIEREITKKLGSKIKSLPGDLGNTIKDLGTYALKNPFKMAEITEISEAFEEGFQGIQSAKAQEFIDNYFDPNVHTRSLKAYLEDPEILEQAFWGMLGGIGFRVAGSGFERIKDWTEAKYKLKHKEGFTKTDYDTLVKGDNYQRIQEIEGRNELLEQYKSKMELINQGVNIFDGKEKHEEFASSIDQENAKQQLTNEYARELAFNAVDAGNLDLLLEYISNPNFSKAIKDAGGTIDENFDSKIINKIKNEADSYIAAKNAVWSNADVESEHIANLAARQIARANDVIEEINSRIEDTNDELSGLLNSEEWKEEYNDYIRAINIQSRVKQHESNIAEFENNYKNGKISKQALDAAVKRENESIDVLFNWARKQNNSVVNDILNNKDTKNSQKADEIFTYYKNKLIEKDGKGEDTLRLSNVPEQVKELHRRILANELQIDNIKAGIPTTKEDYIDLYDNIAYSTYALLNKRVSDALTKVEKWLRNQDNLDEAKTKLLRNEIPSLTLSMDILKVGARNREATTTLFNNIISKLKKERESNINKESKATVDNEPISKDEAKKAADKFNESSPSTGDNTQTNAAEPAAAESKEQSNTPVKEESQEDISPEDKDILARLAEQEKEFEVPNPDVIDTKEQDEGEPSQEEKDAMAIEAAKQAEDHINPNDNPLGIGVPIAFYTIFRNPIYTEEIEKEGANFINTQRYNQLRENIAAKMIDEGLSTANVEANIDICIRTAISKYTEDFRIKDDKSKVGFKEFRDALWNVVSVFKVTEETNENGEQFSKITEKSQEDIINETLTFIDAYFNESNVFRYDDAEGRTPIDLDAAFDYLMDKVKSNQITFEEVALAIRNLVNFYNTVKDSTKNNFILEHKDSNGNIIKYVLLHSNYIASLKESSSMDMNPIYNLLADMYKREFIVEEVNLGTHVQTSNANFGDIIETGYYLLTPDGKHIKSDKYKGTKKSKSEILKSLQNKKIIATPVFDDKGHSETPISVAIGFEDENGNFVEVGYLATVTRSSDNNTLRTNSTEGLGLEVTKDGNDYVFTNNAFVSLINNVLNAFDNRGTAKDKDLAMLFWKYFYKNNIKKFRGKNINFGKNTLHDDIIELFTNKKVIDFILESKFKGLSSYNKDDIEKALDEDPVKVKALFNKIVNSISSILFYPYSDLRTSKAGIDAYPNYDALKISFDNYAKKVWDNYELTEKLQNGNGNIELTYKGDNRTVFNYSPNELGDVSDLKFVEKDTSSYPFVYFNGGTGYCENGSTVNQPYFFKDGTCGLLMDTKNGKPFVATFNESNYVEGSQIGEALKKYISKLVNDYYNSKQSKDRKIAYQQLLKVFNEVCSGGNRLFNGWHILEVNSGFEIYSVDEKTGTYNTLMRFFKYNANYIKGKGYVDVKGNVLSDIELEEHYGNNAKYYDENNEEHIILGNKKHSDNDISNLNAFVDRFIKKLTFNATGVTTRKDTVPNDGILSFDSSNNKMIIKFGDTTLTYDNFTDFVIKNNAFLTSTIANSKQNLFIKHTDDDITSFTVEVKETIDTAPEGTYEQALGFRLGLNQLIASPNRSDLGVINVTDEYTELTPQAYFTLLGIPDETYYAYESAGLIGENGLVPKTIKIYNTPNETEPEANAGYSKDKDVVIYDTGVNYLDSLSQQEKEIKGLRLAVHEQFHKVVEQENFFTDRTYGVSRTNAIIDIFNVFYDKIKSSGDESWIKFADKFFNDYGKLLEGTNKDRAKFANEFAAEVISNRALMDILNNIEYTSKYKINDKAKKQSLLQKLFDILKDLFNFKVDTNTALEAFYISLTVPVKIESFDEINTEKPRPKRKSRAKAISEETQQLELSFEKEKADDTDTLNEPVAEPESPEENQTSSEESETNEETDNDNDDDPYSDLDSVDEEKISNDDYENYFSIFDAPTNNLTNVEIAIDNASQDTKVNHFGVTFVNNMNDYLNARKPQERRLKRSEIENGTLEYICR